MAGRPKLIQFTGGISTVEPDIDIVSNAPRVEPVPVKRKRSVRNILSNLRDIDGEPLSSNQVNILLKLRYGNGDPYFSVDTIADSQTLIEFGSILRDTSQENAIETLLDIRGEYPDDVIWNNSKTQEQLKEAMDTQELELKIEAVEGIGECRQCKSKLLIHKQIQGRSGDEALLSYYQCASCQAKKGNLIFYNTKTKPS